MLSAVRPAVGEGSLAVPPDAAADARPTNTPPNYISRWSRSQSFTQVTSENLQYLLYRPLYWFGGKGLPYLNSDLSLAEPPTYNGQIVTIRLKPNNRWSDGESVNAQDVVFWMHMMKAVVKRSTSSVNWGGYVPGYFPGNVRNIRAVGSYAVKMTIIGHYSTQWFTYNELSQVSPMPLAWDTTGAGHKSDCVQNVTDCLAVFNYLDGLSKNIGTWTRSPLWRF